MPKSKLKVKSLPVGKAGKKLKVGKPKKSKKTVKKPVKIKKTVAKKVATKKAAKPKPIEKVEVKAVEFDSPLVKKYQEHKGDTGSTAVQAAILTDRILELVSHLKKHPKDFDSKRGLLILVGKRRRLLNYLKKTAQPQYEKMVVDLKLRK